MFASFPTVAVVPSSRPYNQLHDTLSMASQPRRPLRDLPIEHFVTPAPHKRPLSPGRSPLYSPAKRRILDAEGISISSGLGNRSHCSRPAFSSLCGAQFSTPYRPSRRGDVPVQRNVPSSSTRAMKSGTNSGTSSSSPSRVTAAQPTSHLSGLWDLHASSNDLPSYAQPSFAIDRQSKHYPGFDIHHDHRIALHAVVEPLPDNGMAIEDDKSEADSCKENVAPKRRTKRISHRSRLSLGDTTSSRLSGFPDKGVGASSHIMCFPAPR